MRKTREGQASAAEWKEAVGKKPRPAAVAAEDVIEAMPIGVVITDLEGKELQYNEASEKMFRAKKGEGIGTHVTDWIVKEDVPRALEAFQEGLRKGYYRGFETTGVRKDGSKFPILVDGTLLRDAGGNPTSIVMAFRDITELKRAEEERVAAFKRAADTIEAMTDGIIVTDLDGNIISANRAMMERFAESGVDLKKFIGKSALDLPLVRREDVGKYTGLMKEVIEKGKVGPLEVRDATGGWSSISVSLLKDAEGNPSALFAVARDITEFKRLQEKEREAAAAAATAEVDKKRVAELTERSAALLSILEDEVEARQKLERAYKELAVHARARTFAFILFKDVFEPLLRECGRRTIGKIRDQVGDLGKRLPITKGVRVDHDGNVTLDEASLRDALGGLTHEEATREITSAFSEIMDACDPIIRADLGDERATATASGLFSSLLERPEVSTYKSDLMRVVPDGVEVPRGYILLEMGRSYLVEERKPTHASRIFSEMVGYGSPGLCISTTHPADVKREHGFKGEATVLWLSKAEKDYSISPSSLGMLRDRITSFTEQNENSVVLLDGLEYLITTNGFDLTVKFLHDLMESVTLNRSRLIVPVSPATLDARQLALLERSMEPIEVVEEE